ncbi:UDP-N-acetylmuramoyl-tripeptide--D-alanyl-D-alanine ligase [Pseudodesulfovibrio indicus]|uniref:UDP-N-acetylmuramoyl-tripeptide--D-alanyl-D-alanine ligase n=1 Tax=Pseudodesulfovibrio indicus TaxID=1716143 RepID=A0A126QL31_9BACT|nr:UDP-N-acetylmuramoyl-tripeptide--D-alanyl-D-alanine ligase [Pseudodesulfovibrio indicus]AMK10672.1 UDP-N-acetylmuramoylalanyl-D-glutamate--2,6-diaminopimelate ligase [Pseudodesulfovibrio indicus]TDT91649.1 UDP-N-acetylmuramoyl-tripeptide--D-alanyl-D-alanine ligase [Pseudodesulfovibrio indicus]
MNLTLAEVARCLGALPDDGFEETVITEVKTDSRTVTGGDLFFCIAGENFDGHEFAAQAAKGGAAAVIASRMIDDVDCPVIMVRDTVAALGRLAACWRDTCGAMLVAVTGTAGKTTVKELLYNVVSQRFATAKNYRNFNNQIGLPLSMLKATAEQEVWIMELGISRRGDMEELAPVASPDLAVITNVGPGHLEGLGNEAGVASAKTSLLRFLRQGGTAVVSKDYPLLWNAALELVGSPVGFTGHDAPGTDFCARFLGADESGDGRFLLRTPEGEVELTAPFCGAHYAENLACVAAAAHHLGLTLDDVAAGVQSMAADPQRFCRKLGGGVMVIDDTYNANPLSMAGSIRTAREMAGDRPLVLVLGDMRELGEEAIPRHEELGKVIREAAPAMVFYKGDHFLDVERGFGGYMRRAGEPDEFLEAWRELCISKGVVLVKGSRSLKMELLANALCREVNAEAQGGPK